MSERDEVETIRRRRRLTGLPPSDAEYWHDTDVLLGALDAARDEKAVAEAELERVNRMRREELRRSRCAFASGRADGITASMEGSRMRAVVGAADSWDRAVADVSSSPMGVRRRDAQLRAAVAEYRALETRIAEVFNDI